ncbi:MAG TPA: hypothetical protein VNE39_08580 [Planctomycetota bacterium]|nr:hypothetical protein [Planctomycetota bacterium]
MLKQQFYRQLITLPHGEYESGVAIFSNGIDIGTLPDEKRSNSNISLNAGVRIHGAVQRCPSMKLFLSIDYRPLLDQQLHEEQVRLRGRTVQGAVLGWLCWINNVCAVGNE